MTFKETDAEVLALIVACVAFDEISILLLFPSVLLKLKYCPFETVESVPLLLTTTIKFSSACVVESVPVTLNLELPVGTNTKFGFADPLAVVLNVYS